MLTHSETIIVFTFSLKIGISILYSYRGCTFPSSPQQDRPSENTFHHKNVSSKNSQVILIENQTSILSQN